MQALLVDDESLARERLARLLADATDVEVVGEAADGREALEQIEALAPDVVFLDIEMPELDGLGVAEALGEGAPRIVFVTAYDEYALRAFEAAAVDYLVKPVKQARLEQTLERLRRMAPRGESLSGLLREMRAGRPGRLAVKSGARYLVLDLEQVPVIRAQDHYTAIVHAGREVLCDDSMDTLSQRLRPHGFLRVHRSTLVNLDWVDSLQREGERRYALILRDEGPTRVLVSRNRLADVKAALGI